MITKERLEELIKQGATIYIPNNRNVDCICLDAKYKPELFKDNKGYYGLSVYKDTIDVYPIEYLFETKEDARWELEMTATRIETLKLPTWEKFKEIRFVEFFYNEYDYMLQYQNISQKIAVYERNNKGDYFSMKATKENYIEACKLCLKLFKGEEV